jgi:glutamate--cysteine ligase
MVPHLATALTGPIDELEQRILDSMPAIERWFRMEWMEHTPSFYSAADIRNAGFKLSVVDVDLYPGAWNQLAPEMMPLAVQGAMAAIEKICPEARNLMLVPDYRIQDPAYFSGLAQLVSIFHMAGLNVRVGSIDPALKGPKVWTLANGAQLDVEPVQREGQRLKLRHFDPCTILLNHDLGQGVPGIMEDLSGQYLLPPLHASWSMRQRSSHYRAYEDVAKRFGKLLGVDPWLIHPLYQQVAQEGSDSTKDLRHLAGPVDELLQRIRRKYRDYGIEDKPYVAIKANTGRDASGLLTVRDVKELDDLMLPETGLSANSDWVLQEGVRTHERIHDDVAEPVVYMIDRYVVGGFYRVHAGRRDDEGLLSPSASVVPLAFAPQPATFAQSATPNRFYMYGVMARLAMLAASYELEATDPLAEVYD